MSTRRIIRVVVSLCARLLVGGHGVCVLDDDIRCAVHNHFTPYGALKPAPDQLPDAENLYLNVDKVASVTGSGKPHVLAHEKRAGSGQPGADHAGHQAGQKDAVHQGSVAGVHGVCVPRQSGKIFHVPAVDASRRGHAIADDQRDAAGARGRILSTALQRQRHERVTAVAHGRDSEGTAKGCRR